MVITRSLGEGIIVKLVKRYAFIQDDKLGKIYFPLEAALATTECVDLRDKFKENDKVIFTAQKQNPPHNDCNFVASSVVKKNELITVSGCISDIFEKYAYAEVPKLGKVFVPFSARNEVNKAWIGKGAELGAECTLKIMRQPEVRDCQYVAFAIYFGDGHHRADEILNGVSEVPLQRQSHARMERQPDFVPSQIGIIVSHAGAGVAADAFAYSSQTGLARIPFASLTPAMGLGSWIQYDVVKYVLVDQPKCTWRAEKISALGLLMPVEKSADSKRVVVEAVSVVCRVSTANRAAWLWNDLLGRIYVCSYCFVSRMKAFTVARVRAQYTGNFEDVPWSAVEMSVIGDKDEERNSCAQLLLTDDNWQVKYISEQQSGTFYGFMENEKFGSAFIAWTDMTESDFPPHEGALCRATVYKQFRDKKHAWRAVMVSPMDEHGQPTCHHPFIRMSGQMSGVPTPLPPPPPPQPSTIMMPIPLRANSHELTAPTSDFESMISKCILGEVSPLTSPISCNRVPSESSDSNSELTTDVDFLSTNSSNRNLNSHELSPVFHDTMRDTQNISLPDLWHFDSLNGLGSEAIFSMSSSLNTPRNRILSDVLFDQTGESRTPVGTLDSVTRTHSTTARRASLVLGGREPGTKAGVDVGTQTDLLYEQTLLRDILSNNELLMKVLETFPSQATNIVKLNWRN